MQNEGVCTIYKEPRECIRVRNAVKIRGRSNVILKKLDMTVPQGVIYGLLGPSGCGKTTLLQCLIGRMQLDAGSIYVKRSGKNEIIGYMPQDVALYTEFSIIENFTYYGTIFGLTRKEIKAKSHEVLKFLQLPHRKTRIENLSGGQQRRVSFAVTLLHDSSLLILDEPTVGVDPLLSASIWEHLSMISRTQRKTIIITTHYIEDARKADIIGLMRNGRIMIEESPTKLLTRYDSDSLEDVFLSLIKEDNQDHSLSSSDLDVSTNNNNDYSKPSADRPKISFSCRRIKAMLIKNVFWMKRNIMVMTFMLLLPMLQIVLFNENIGNRSVGLKIAVVNDEMSGYSNCIGRSPITSCNASVPISCAFLKYITDKGYHLFEADNVESANNMIRHNQAWATLHVPHNFTIALASRLERLDNDNLEGSNLNVWQDMSNQNIGFQLQLELRKFFVEFSQFVFSDCGWNARGASIPIKMETPVFGASVKSFRDGFVPQHMAVLSFYFPIIQIVAALLMEKSGGRLERTLSAGGNLFEVCFAQFAIQFAILCLQSFCIIFMHFYVYSCPLTGNGIYLFSFLTFIGLEGMCYGLLVAIICATEMEATLLSVGTYMMLLMLSGIIWPLEGVHKILRSVEWLLPMTYMSEAFHAIALRAWPITNPIVLRGVISGSLWIAVFIIVSCTLIRFKKGIIS